MMRGLTADTLATWAHRICDFALDGEVPVLFEHRGRTLQIAVWDPD